MDLVKLLPDRPTMSDTSLSAWLMDHGGRGREVLTYRKEKIRNPLTEQLEPVARCTCSACGGEWLTNVYGYNGTYPEFENHDGICLNGHATTCPECGAKVEAAYYTRLKKHPIKSTAYPWEVINIGGNIAFICWAIIYEIDEYGPALYPEKRNAYVLDTAGHWHRFTAMQRMGWSSMSGMEYTGHWYKMDKFSVTDGGWSKVLPHDPAVYEGTALENAKLEKLEATGAVIDLLLYARTYTRHKAIENITQNTPMLAAAAMQYIKGPMGLDWINWKTARPHEMLYMDKQEYKAVAGLSEPESREIIARQHAVAICKAWGAPKEYAGKLGAAGIGFAIDQKKNETLHRWGLVATWNYICKQAAAMADQPKRDRLQDAISLCVDYWADMEKAGLDTESRVVVFPSNVRTAHARAVQAIKYAQDEKLRKAFAKQAERLAPLQWEHGDLLITPAQNEGQLIAEGKILGHCVGGYGESHCKGKSIFFIRHTDAPDLPFYTLQLNTKTGVVLQNRGERNRDRTQEVRDFEEQWLAVIVTPWIQKKTKTAKPAAV